MNKNFSEYMSEMPTKEMVDFFYNRTAKHVDAVKKYIQKIQNIKDYDFPDLEYRKNTHDQSKYKHPELVPYVFVTWKHHAKDNGIQFTMSEDMENQLSVAIDAHFEKNRHHPEYHTTPKQMTDTDIAEMVDDWCAVSEERNTHQNKMGR